MMSVSHDELQCQSWRMVGPVFPTLLKVAMGKKTRFLIEVLVNFYEL